MNSDPNYKHKFSRRPAAPAAKTSWDPLAHWYDGWMGQSGSKYHQLIALPETLKLLQPKFGEKILDIGSGQGVLCEEIVKVGAEYVGVDASPTLVEIARKRHGQIGKFVMGNAGKMAETGLEKNSFDAAVFLLSIQDMTDLSRIIENATRMIKPDGRLVLFLTHPSFRIPRQSGWGEDEGRGLIYRRVDSYLSEMDIPLKAFPGKQKGVSVSHHRPLQSYMKVLQENGWVIESLVEPTESALLGEKAPRNQKRAVQEIPMFLGLRAIRKR